MSEYFKRQIELWGEEIQDTLKQKKIAIIGCGGLGSTLGITLGSSGIGEIHLVDFDTVSIHNIHRQIAFKISDIDRYKCECLAELITSRCEVPKVHTYALKFDDFAKMDIDVDLIIDATDNLPTRVAIDEYGKKKNTPWLYASVEEFNGQVCFFEKSSFKAFNITNRKPAGITPPIVSFIASLQANFALRYLAGLSVEKDKLNYLFFNKDGGLEHNKFDMPY
jgi:molybdopterin/thiamine biosynthesis adenylyltransferase